MSTTLTTLSAAAPAAGWVVHGLWMRRRLHAARRDPLTGLPTRDLFTARAGQMTSDARTVVCLIDLDGFKALNDTHGHAAGDAVLAATARRLRDRYGARAALARLGGDEFALAARIREPQAARHAAELHAYLTRPVPTEFGVLVVGCSLGIARTADHPRADLTVLLRAADEAMYAAKRAGGGWQLAHPEQERLPQRHGRRVGRTGAFPVPERSA